MKDNHDIESARIALLLQVQEPSTSWAHQERGVYTSEVMEAELNRLFPVDTFLENRNAHNEHE